MLTSIYRGGAGSGDGNNYGAPSEEPNDGERASTRAMAKERLNSICSICWCDACIQCENCLCDLYGSNLQHNHVSQLVPALSFNGKPTCHRVRRVSPSFLFIY